MSVSAICKWFIDEQIDGNRDLNPGVQIAAEFEPSNVMVYEILFFDIWIYNFDVVHALSKKTVMSKYFGLVMGI